MTILPIHSIVSVQTGVFMHNCYSDRLPSSLNNYFNLNCSVHVYNTRNINNFHPPFFRTELSTSTILNIVFICHYVFVFYMWKINEMK